MAYPPSWVQWASGVLNGIQAPVNSTNLASLWKWSNFESGANVMRWNNPLNTTQPWANAINQNSVGVKQYATTQDGINATVVTLQNGRYPNIISNLRNSTPLPWWNATTDLTTWGSGTSWMGSGSGASTPSGPIQPAGYFIPPKGQTPPGQNQPTTNQCITSWGILGASICMDGIIGGAAIAAGGAVFVVGILLIVVISTRNTAAGRAATGALRAAAGPVGLVSEAGKMFQQQKRESAPAPTPEQQQQASQQRTATARARVQSPISEDEERSALRAEMARGVTRPKPGAARRARELQT